MSDYTFNACFAVLGGLAILIAAAYAFICHYVFTKIWRLK